MFICNIAWIDAQLGFFFGKNRKFKHRHSKCCPDQHAASQMTFRHELEIENINHVHVFKRVQLSKYLCKHATNTSRTRSVPESPAHITDAPSSFFPLVYFLTPALVCCRLPFSNSPVFLPFPFPDFYFFFSLPTPASL